MASPVSSWPIVVLFWNVIMTVFPLNVLLVTITVVGVAVGVAVAVAVAEGVGDAVGVGGGVPGIVK